MNSKTGSKKPFLSGIRLSELREQFKKRRTDGDQLFECSYEHLEGFAYSLSSQCLVQWSIDFPWESK